MATLTLFQGFLPGVDQATLTEGEGLTGPRLTNATCWRVNSIHIDFNSAMLVRLPEGLVGEVTSYKVYEKANPTVELAIIRVVTFRTAPATAEVFVQGMVQGTEYTLEVIADVLDEYGTPIDHSYDTADFLGLGHQVPAPGGLALFIGLEAGAQKLTETDWRPDLDPPYVVNPDPAPGSIFVDPAYIPSIDLCDDGSGVRVASTRIWVNGTLIFQNNTSIDPGWIVGVTPIVSGYHYALVHVDPLPNYLITVRIYGEDLAVIPNHVDYTWDFDASSAIIDAPTRRHALPYTPVIDLNLLRVSLTSRARYFIARGAGDGTVLVPTRFVLGAGWENPRWGEMPFPSPEATEVSNPVFEGSIYDGLLQVEEANASTFVLRCAGPTPSMDFTPTEVMVYAEIHNSPLATENYREIPFACATFPSWFHVSDQRFVTRLVLPVG